MALARSIRISAYYHDGAAALLRDIVRRLLGKDPMHRALDPDQNNYRVQSTKSPKEKLERPF